MQKTAIIIPCYNEALRLKLDEFIKCTMMNKYVHFIFVNDGSTDETQEILDSLCRSNPIQMQCIKLEKNSGKAEAVRKGFIRAIQMNFANMGYWDADLSTPLGVIPKFCELLNSPRIKMVIGSRVRLLGRRIKRRASRHYLGRVFATCASLVLGLQMYDTQCGAKIFKNGEELRMVFNEPFIARWTFDVEIFARFIMVGAPIIDTAVEFPLEEWADVPGSKIKIKDFFLAIIELFKILLFLRVPFFRRRFFNFSAGGN